MQRLEVSCAVRLIQRQRVRGKLDKKITRKKCKVLVDDLKEMRMYWKLENVSLDGNKLKDICGRGNGPVIRETVLRFL